MTIACPRCGEKMPFKGLGKHAVTKHVRRGGRGVDHATNLCETPGCTLGAVGMDKDGKLRCGNCAKGAT